MDTKRLVNWATRIPNKPWFPLFALALITLLAAALRFYKLGEWSFWIDEIFTINRAQAHYINLDRLLDNIPPARNWVPISVILTAQALNLFGVSEWSARLVSTVIGIITIPILYFPIKNIFGTRVTLIALLLLAISPWHIFWSQNARFYTTLMLFFTLALVTFHYGLERNRPRYFILFFLLVYLALSERLFALFIAPVIAAYLIALWIFKFEKPPGLNFKNMLSVGLPIIVGGVVELSSLIASGESRFFGDFGWFFLYRNDDPIRLLGNIGFNTGIPLMVLASFSGFIILIKKNRPGLLMLSSAVVPMTMLIAANPFIFTKDRYVFLTLFCWIILAAYGINELVNNTKDFNKILTVAVLAVLVFDSASDNLLYYRVNHGNRGEWRTAFNKVRDKIQNTDIVVAYWSEFGPFYLDREITQYEKIDLESMLQSGKRYWFVLDAETIWANVKVKWWLENNAELIEVYYLRTPDDFYLRVYFVDPVRLKEQ
jgi:mannosyltransferase